MQGSRAARRSRRLVIALITLTAGCSPAVNPVLHIPALSSYLTLKGQIVSDSGTPIVADLTVLRLPSTGRADTIRSMRVAPGARFHFDSLAPGAYALNTRSLGFHQREDTLLLSAPPGLEVVLPLRRVHYCLGICPPDPLVVAAAHAQQAHWQCDHESANIKRIRARWAALLADTVMQAYFHHNLTPSQVAKQLQTVRKDSICRRLAITLFPIGTTLAYTVFRWPPYWLLSDPSFDEALVATDSLRPLVGSSGGGYLVWATERRAP